jgi:hypothetical protein
MTTRLSVARGGPLAACARERARCSAHHGYPISLIHVLEEIS